MTRWLVDGMNVIGSRPDGWWRDRAAAMRRLVAQLESLDGEVAVVFDGEPFDLASDRIEVLFARRRGPNAADDDIAGLVQREYEPGGLSVVTSYGDLAGRVRAAGAAVVGAADFRRRLDG